MTQDQRLPVAVGLDTSVVVLFVAIGLRSHEQESTFVAIIETAVPFLIGLGVAWLVVRAWRRPTRAFTGLALWPITVLVGMMVRNQVFDDGTAASFVVVATLFLGCFIVGWRLVLGIVERRHRTTPPLAVSRRVPGG